MLEYIFIAFIAILGIQFIYYIFIFGAFSFASKAPKQATFNIPVSVIICAKNEAQNLTTNIPLFINQNYSNFELVLINDGSNDHSLEVMEQFQQTHPEQIKIVNVAPNEQFWGSKKYALTLGIKAATNEHLLFTDADCKPVSNNWITEMTQHFSEDKELILGYGGYKKIRNSFLNKIIRFETLITAIQYFSFAKIGMPYMGVGRNLAYTKNLFFTNKGFVNHIKIKSGDDDLFVNQVANKKNTTFCFSNNSSTISNPKTTFKSWIQQKRRHISTASHYKKTHKLLLGLFYTSQLLFWVLGILLLSFLYKWQFVVALIIFRSCFHYISIGFAAKKLNEKDVILFLPFYELFLIFVQLFIFIKNIRSKPSHW
ncbi:glycosyltransferase [Lutibacter holmesii]|uniref:Glycosyltransferase n=1 Tax=Lutibacter holmesii TaxID=1137985 RepID=A0ABW3WL77_9FLAO